MQIAAAMRARGILPSLIMSFTRSRSRARSLRQILLLVLGALVIASLIRIFIAEPFIVTGSSMQPSYRNNDYLVIDLVSYHFKKPQRGEIIVFRYPLDPSLYLVKRVVALPGEIVDEASGKVEGTTASTTITLANDEYYVLGDNASESTDSRQWGPLQERFIVGRVALRLWPLF